MAKIDDSVKKKVPELRFPFTDDWEERKLENYLILLVVEHQVHRTLNTGTVILIGMHQLKLENKVMLVKVKRLLLN